MSATAQDTQTIGLTFQRSCMVGAKMIDRNLQYLIPPPDAIRTLLARHRYALLLDGLGSGPFAAHTFRMHSNPRICAETVAMYIYEAQRLGRPYCAEVLAWDGRQWIVMEQEPSPAEEVAQ